MKSTSLFCRSWESAAECLADVSAYNTGKALGKYEASF